MKPALSAFILAWRKSRTMLITSMLVLCLCGFIASIWSLYKVNIDNQMIASLKAGRDVALPKQASPELMFARLHFLVQRALLDDAQSLLVQLSQAASPAMLARAHYDLANARLRQAFDFLEQTNIQKAEPLVRLARTDYRQALALDPDFWDARYNLDVAMRLIRDFPDFQQTRGDEMIAKPKELWTDLPGRPKGLP